MTNGDEGRYSSEGRHSKAAIRHPSFQRVCELLAGCDGLRRKLLRKNVQLNEYDVAEIRGMARKLFIQTQNLMAELDGRDPPEFVEWHIMLPEGKKDLLPKGQKKKEARDG
jgi:hypothetical protein